MKVTIDKCAEVLKRNKATPELLRAVVAELNLLAQANTAAYEEKPPAVKKQFVIVVSNPNETLKGHDFAGWVVQIPEEESPIVTEGKLQQAAYDFNATKRGRLLPVQTIGEAIENVPSKIFKEHGVWVKTKTPVLVIRTNNELPEVEKLCSGSGNSPHGVDPHVKSKVEETIKTGVEKVSNVIPMPGSLTPASWDNLDDLEEPEGSDLFLDDFVSRLRDIYIDSEEGLRDFADRKEEARVSLALYGLDETKQLREFLRLNSDKVPGALEAIGHIDAAIGAQKAAESASKSSATVGHSGTVSVPSDEGSRDDAGPDSKTNL